MSSLTFPFYLTAMRRPELASDPRFSTPALRAKNLEAFHAIVQNWILTFDSLDTLDAQLDEAKLAFGVVRDISDFARSDWAEWWGAIDEVDDRAGGMVRIPGKPWRFSVDKLDHPGMPAFRGEHNEEVLKELGLCENEINALARKGAITADPLPQ